MADFKKTLDHFDVTTDLKGNRLKSWLLGIFGLNSIGLNLDISIRYVGYEGSMDRDPAFSIFLQSNGDDLIRYVHTLLY